MQHDFPFDPTYRHTEKSLLQIAPPTPPADLASFWHQACRQARQVPLDLTLRPMPSPDPDRELFEIAYTSLGNARIHGWYHRPRNRKVRRGVVETHGYGGRQEPCLLLPGPEAAVIQPCARGLPMSRQHPLPDTADRHVLHGIESRDTYIHLGCAADLWAAATALLELHPDAGANLDYMGASFGGGLGALAVPWDPRFRRAYLGVPSFGNHPLRVTLQCTGSGESVRQRYLADPKIMDVLRYFDAASTAQFMKIPTLVAAALFDPAVPPPGQFSVYNALPQPRELFVRQAAHFEFAEKPAEEQQLFQRLDAWFAQGMN